MVTIRSAYDGTRVDVDDIDFGDEPSRTKQSFKEECDINNVLAKFQRTGVIEHVRKYGPEYGFAPATDYLEAMLIVQQGREMFEALPSSLRSRFETPEAFLEFVQDENNLDEMRELGLARPRAAETLSGGSEGSEQGSASDDSQPAEGGGD